ARVDGLRQDVLDLAAVEQNGFGRVLKHFLDAGQDDLRVAAVVEIEASEMVDELLVVGPTLVLEETRDGIEGVRSKAPAQSTEPPAVGARTLVADDATNNETSDGSESRGQGGSGQQVLLVKVQ